MLGGMRVWMLPWLLPLVILVLAITLALAPWWVGALVVAVIVILIGLAWRSCALDGAGRELPNWMRSLRQHR
jgi:hypothetical protein